MKRFLKRFASVIAALCLLLAGGLCRAASHGQKVHLHGYLIDNSCWSERDGKDVQSLLREHTKDCLQMPDCSRSGYSIVTGSGSVYPLDAASNTKVTAWIDATQRDADWQVDVKGIWLDGKLDVKKIELQRARKH
jgi:hypothetical protein